MCDLPSTVGRRDTEGKQVAGIVFHAFGWLATGLVPFFPLLIFLSNLPISLSLSSFSCVAWWPIDGAKAT